MPDDWTAQLDSLRAWAAAHAGSAGAWAAAQARVARAWLTAHPLEASAAALVLAGALLALGLARRRAASARAAPETAAPAVEAVAPAPEVAARVEPPAGVAPGPPEAVAEPAAEPVAGEPPPEPALEALAPAAPPEPEAPRFSLASRLRRTSENLVGRLGQLMGDRRVDADLLDELEAALFAADLGVGTVDGLLAEVRKRASGGDAEAVRRVLREAVRAKLRRVEAAPPPLPQGTPHVILVLGVNGSGKTTTIGKLAALYIAQGRRVLLGAGDTFRAAAAEQLQLWGERVGCEVVAGPPGGDPAAVAFDAVKAARARGADVAIVDTAGRLQTQRPLMEELAKVARVIGREIEGAPHETLLVLDANTGQNAISQARLFTEAAPISGLVLTKLDGTAKGGVIVGLADEFGIPVRYVGVGESPQDLRAFAADEFVEALFDPGEA